MKYSIITTCKGRLKNLRCSLPQFLKQKEAEVVVVDYDCPENTEEYVKKEYPSVRVTSIKDQPKFNTSHARNIGAQIARGRIFAFLDADVIVDDNFLQSIQLPSDKMTYITFGFRDEKSPDTLRGSCLIRREDFFAVEGYDELLSGYEGEDLDIYMRLRNLGVKPFLVRTDKIACVLEQNIEERLRYRPSQDIKLQFLRGQLYQLAKEMVLKTQGETVIDLNTRKHILDQVCAQIGDLYAGRKEFNLTIAFPDKYRRRLLKDWEFATAITVRSRHRGPSLVDQAMNRVPGPISSL
jgi:glycosyltransferase involved in cell wall biosynthesis